MAASLAVPREIPELVARFGGHVEEYRDGHYNETQVRRDFIDPFFGALGWDVHNTKDYAEAYREVIHEDAIRVGGATKAPDYCFRIGGLRKFFVEAKRPSVDLKHDVHPAYQLRRYAWSAKLPLSILTDFEELAVYDTWPSALFAIASEPAFGSEPPLPPRVGATLDGRHGPRDNPSV